MRHRAPLKDARKCGAHYHFVIKTKRAGLQRDVGLTSLPGYEFLLLRDELRSL